MQQLREALAPLVATMGGPITALHRVMHTVGWIDDAAAALVAEMFNLSRAEVAGLISFYADFKTCPPAARVIKVCQAEACQARGAVAVTERLQKELGITVGECDADQSIELQAVHCLGMCAHGPALVDDEGLHLQVRANELEALLAGARPPACRFGESNPLDVDTPSHVVAQTRLIFQDDGHADPLDLEAYRARGGFAHTTRAGAEILQAVASAGLRGRGGAGFPAHIKWQTVAAQAAAEKFVVCNADEGDSGTFADRLIMERDPYLLLEGMALAARAVGAAQGYIYLRSEYPYAAKVMAQAIERVQQTDLFGGTFAVELFMGAGAYICGEETALLESLEGKRGVVRAKPPLPAVAGLLGQPTLVHNVITLCAVPWIVKHGGERYRQYGVGASTGTMPFQLSGNVKTGGIVEVPFGMTVRELVEKFGGGTLSGRPIKAIQVGGPLGAYLSAAQFDTPLTYEAMQAIGAGIGHGGIVVFDDTVNMAQQAQHAFAFCAAESCGKCTPCRIGATRGEELVQEIRKQGASAERLRLLDELCDVMEAASLCQMGGMTPIPVRSAVQQFPADFLAEEGA